MDDLRAASTQCGEAPAAPNEAGNAILAKDFRQCLQNQLHSLAKVFADQHESVIRSLSARVKELEEELELLRKKGESKELPSELGLSGSEMPPSLDAMTPRPPSKPPCGLHPFQVDSLETDQSAAFMLVPAPTLLTSPTASQGNRPGSKTHSGQSLLLKAVKRRLGIYVPSLIIVPRDQDEVSPNESDSDESCGTCGARSGQPSKNSARWKPANSARSRQSSRSRSRQKSVESIHSIEAHGFVMLPHWEAGNTQMRLASSMLFKKLKACSSLATSSLSCLESSLQISGNRENPPARCWVLLADYVVSPSKPQIIGWSCVGLLLVIWDCVFVPLQVLTSDSPDELAWLSTPSWIIRIYWTCDLLPSFVTGYSLPNGDTEMNPHRVVRHYFFTWFAFDILIIGIDWFDAIDNGSTSQAGDAAMLGKTLKVIRLLRLARMMRLVRFTRTVFLTEMLGNVYIYIRSPVFSSVMGIMKTMAIVVLACHTLGCIWYRIGADSPNSGWVQEYGYADANTFYAYAIAVHWAISQLDGLVHEGPTNESERYFAVVVRFFGFFVATVVVSTITSRMTKLELLTVERAANQRALQQFLYDNGISRRLALRIQRNALYALHEHGNDTPERSVRLLELVSEPLALSWHPFFVHVRYLSMVLAQEICHQALHRQSVMSGELVFSIGPVAKSCMYFLTRGEAAYMNGPSLLKVNLVNEGCALSEQSLWSFWSHAGTLMAKTDCQLLCVDSLMLQSILKQSFVVEAFRLANCYATLYVSKLNVLSTEELTDLLFEDVDDLVEQAARETQTERHDDTKRALKSLRSSLSLVPQVHMQGWGLGQKLVSTLSACFKS